MRMSVRVGIEERFEPVQMSRERHVSRSRNSPRSHRLQLIGVAERPNQSIGKRRCGWRISRDEISGFPWSQPLADAAQVERNCGNTESRSLQSNETKGLGPGTWNSEQARTPQPHPALVA